MFLFLSLMSSMVIDKSLQPLGDSVSSFLNGDDAFLKVNKKRGAPSNSTPTHIPKRHDNICPHRKNVYVTIHSSIFITSPNVHQLTNA